MHERQKNSKLDICIFLVSDAITDFSFFSTGKTVLSAQDYMDDGSIIKLTITINEETGSAICDFTGSGHQVWGNCNAPRAITFSAIIYCLRCMVGHDIPLNQVIYEILFYLTNQY